MPEELKARLRRLVDEYNKGNINAADELYVSDCIYHTPPLQDLQGLEAFKKVLTDIVKGYPDFKMKIDEIIVEGDTSVERVSWKGTHKGQIGRLPIPPTGKEVEWSECVVAHYVGGNIVEQWEYIDLLGGLQQLGVIPSM